MKRPFYSLKIAGKRHRVRWGVDIEGDCGLYEQLPLTISIADGMAPDEERETVLHEVFHAADWQANTKLKEKQVRQLSIFVFELLRANPKLVEYLLKDEGDDAA